VKESDSHGNPTAWMQDDCMDTGGRATQEAEAETILLRMDSAYYQLLPNRNDTKIKRWKLNARRSQRGSWKKQTLRKHRLQEKISLEFGLAQRPYVST
jgi:hypothetical protein